MEKWCGWFLSRGHEVHMISFTDGKLPGVVFHRIDLGLSGSESDLAKLKYLTQGKRIRRLVKDIKPDVVNVHYATSYGAVAALSGIRGYVLSVWGADVYDFPRKSPLHRLLLRYSLSRAKLLFSTSRAMAKETRKYTRKAIKITPFGVDTELFTPDKRSRGDDKSFVIGTVKKLEPKYGIDVLLKAAAILREKLPELRIVIAGNGVNEKEYHQMAEELGLGDIIRWTGFIPQEEAAKLWADLDAAVIPSVLESESFGVAAVEAEASGVPVVISDVPGLMEATRPGYTSVVVPRKDPEKLAEALLRLAEDEELRRKLGRNGRRFAVRRYSLDVCFEGIEEKLEEICRERH